MQAKIKSTVFKIFLTESIINYRGKTIVKLKSLNSNLNTNQYYTQFKNKLKIGVNVPFVITITNYYNSQFGIFCKTINNSFAKSKIKEYQHNIKLKKLFFKLSVSNKKLLVDTLKTKKFKVYDLWRYIFNKTNPLLNNVLEQLEQLISDKVTILRFKLIFKEYVRLSYLQQIYYSLKLITGFQDFQNLGYLNYVLIFKTKENIKVITKVLHNLLTKKVTYDLVKI